MKQSWGLKVLNKAANQVGLSVVRSGGYRLPALMQFFGLSVVWGRWEETEYISKGYSQNAALYSVITRIARTAASCPFKVYKVVDKKKHLKIKAWSGPNATSASLLKAMLHKELAYEEDTTHPLNGLIDNPNPWQGGHEYVEASVSFKLLTGNRFLLLTVLDMGANMGNVASIFNLPPQSTAVLGDGSLFGVREYELQVGRPLKIPVENIIHSKYFNPNITTTGEHLRGLSPLSAGSRPLDISTAADNRSIAMLRNAGAAGMIYSKTVDALTPEQAAVLKAKINDEVLGFENAARIAIGNGDMGYLDFAKTFGEMGIHELGKYSLQQLCNIYSVPYILLSADNSTYNNIREAKKELITMAVLPELVSLRDDWNKIAAKFGADIYIDFDLSVYPELQEDMEKTMRIMKDAWWYTGNEKRIAMGADEDTIEPMMKKYLVPSGLQEIGNLNAAVIDQQMNIIDQTGNNQSSNGQQNNGQLVNQNN